MRRAALPNLAVLDQGGACGAAGPASAPGSAVERPARRTPGHVTGAHQISPALGYTAVQRTACAPRPDRPACPLTLRGGGCAARDEHDLAGPWLREGAQLPEGTPENHPRSGDVASAFRADNENTPENSLLGLEVQDNG